MIACKDEATGRSRSELFLDLPSRKYLPDYYKVCVGVCVGVGVGVGVGVWVCGCVGVWVCGCVVHPPSSLPLALPSEALCHAPSVRRVRAGWEQR